MRAGPKPTVVAGPLGMRLPKAGGARVIAFCEQLTIPKGTGAKKRVRLREWQKEIVRGLFDDPRPRQGLVSIPRGNGKSTLAAMLGLYGLYADGVEGAQVLCVASDERQARIVANTARRMVELTPHLLERTQVFQGGRLYVPETDSSLFALPAEAAALQGFDPSCLIIDELHVVSRDTWEGATLAAGKRDKSLTLAISTPAGDDTGVMWDLVEHGRAGDDSSFFYAEFAAPSGCAVDDEAAWHEANPALGDFLHIDAMRATLRTTRESSFRRFRLGQWVEDLEGAWLPPGVWDACAVDGFEVADGADVVLVLAGSPGCTALVAASVDEVPHLQLVALWESDGGPVPVADVEAAIRTACRRWQVAEVAADPYRFSRISQTLLADGLPMEELPQTASTMTPATVRMLEAVCSQTVTHDGDARLARHIGACRVTVDARGERLSRPHKSTTRRIDAAVAAVVAHDRAATLAAAPKPRTFWGAIT